MKAIRVTEHGGPEVLRLATVIDPRPGAGEVLVRMEAVGVNFIDVYFRKGLYSISLPYTPGSEGAGVVVEVGAGVTDVTVGERVASQGFNGAYAELAVARADKVVRVPDGMAMRDAGAALLQGMTAHYLTHSLYPLVKGEHCLVHAAAGGVGLLLCQMANRIGATVIGTVSTEEKAALARGAGAHETIDYTREDFVLAVKRITAGAGVHVVYDSVGATTFLKSLECLRPLGTMALFGQSSGPVAPFDPNILNARGSLFLTRPTLGHYVATREALLWRAGDVLGGIVSGALSIRIDRETPLANAAEAHRALESRVTTGKVILSP